MTFEQWMQQVDSIFFRKVGLSHEDWPDQCYYDSWEDGLTPLEMVSEAVFNEYGEEGCEAYGLPIP